MNNIVPINDKIDQYNKLAISIGTNQMKPIVARYQLEYIETIYQASTIKKELRHRLGVETFKQPMLFWNRVFHPIRFKRLTPKEYLDSITDALVLTSDIIQLCNDELTHREYTA